MRRTIILIVTLLSFVPAVPALAHHERGGCDSEQNGNCNDQNKKCNNAGDNCSDNDFSPTFDKSPVDHSFNPQICVMPGSCSPRGQDGPREP